MLRRPQTILNLIRRTLLAHAATLVLYEPPACDPQSSCQEAKRPKPIPAPAFFRVTSHVQSQMAQVPRHRQTQAHHSWQVKNRQAQVKALKYNNKSTSHNVSLNLCSCKAQVSSSTAPEVQSHATQASPSTTPPVQSHVTQASSSTTPQVHSTPRQVNKI